jgi:hypothetical protein
MLRRQGTEWVSPDELELPFVLKEYDPEVHVREVTLRWSRDDVRHKLKGVELLLPNHISKLLWFPWPDWVPMPADTNTGIYHKVRNGYKRNELVRQPRTSRCYVRTYEYSGSIHPMEDTVPDDIQNLLDETTAIYNAYDTDRCGIATCLVNEYPTKRHYVSVHRDDPKLFGGIKDVICWVVGVTRRLIIRDYATKRVVINVQLPEGLYIMRGSKFQKEYTHEIPQEMSSTFTMLQSYLPPEIAELDTLLQADWLASHGKDLRKVLTAKDYARYKNWTGLRVSYTIRFAED